MNPSPSVKSSSVSQISGITLGSNFNSTTGQQVTTISSSNYVKRPRFMTIFTSVSNLSFSISKPMLIHINNSILSISFLLRLKTDDDNCIRMLVYTGAAMNTGDKIYHLWVMS